VGKEARIGEGGNVKDAVLFVQSLGRIFTAPLLNSSPTETANCFAIKAVASLHLPVLIALVITASMSSRKSVSRWTRGRHGRSVIS